jgi:eukaryotic-like serine/threonine-protein kinase
MMPTRPVQTPPDKPPIDGTAETAVGLATPRDDGPGERAVRAEPAAASDPGDPGDPWLDRVLDDRYRIVERLGEGGMGAVFIAEHLKLHKRVAIKVIRAELAGNGEVAARFAREAMATARFEHPHVASAIDYGTLPEGGAYLVMQLVRGQPLRNLLEAQNRLTWPKACELLAQVADALSAARGAGIVHRDLKPENIVVETREDGTALVKILDFGIAHVTPRNETAQQADRLPSGAPATRELTRVGTVMGTPGYMAPEQAVGDKIDHRTDLYALGVVLWECIAGRCLWDGPDVTAIIAHQMSSEVPRLRELLADASIPRELDALVQSLCAKRADARPEHAGVVRDALRSLVQRHAARPGAALGFAHAWQAARLRARALSPLDRSLIVGAILATGLGIAALNSRPPAADTATQALANVLGGEGAQREPQLPSELAADAKAVLEAPRIAERRKAAQALLAFPDSTRVPVHLLAIARLENARACRDRKEAIAELVKLVDARGLEPLRRLSSASKTGCGFLDLEDCYACIRGDLRRAIAAIETATSSAPPP